MKKTLAYISLCLFCSSSFAAVAPSPVSPGYVPGNSSLLDEVIEATYIRNNLNTIADNSIGRQLVAPTELSAFPLLSGLQVGAGLALPSIAYYERTGKDPVYAAYEAVASGLDAVFVPAYQAFKANFVSPESYPASAAQYVGVEGSVGATVGDIVDFVKNSADSAYTSLRSLIGENVVVNAVDASQVSPGQVIEIEGNNYIILSGPSGAVKQSLSTFNSNFPYIETSLGRIYLISGNQIFVWNGEKYNTDLAWMYNYSIAPTTSPVTLYPEISTNYPALATALSSPSPAVAEDLKDAIKDLPSEQKITSSDPSPTEAPAQNPAPITSNQVSNFFTANTTNVYNEYLNTVNNGGDVNTSQAAAELAKAQAEEAQKEAEETFSPISDNPFQQPYNPGEFDIPTRFTAFISNVKSSGLFSFSTNFFGSLPTGGSPLYTINGGDTYGTHTIDLNDTLSPGLDVLKAVLLACFGFLSIRAVVMKR